MITSRSIKLKQQLQRRKEEDKTVSIQLTFTMNHEIEKNDMDNIIDEYTKNHNFLRYDVVEKEKN